MDTSTSMPPGATMDTDELPAVGSRPREATDDRRSFTANLDFYGVTLSRAELIARSGEVCTLDTTPGAVSATAPHRLTTADLDQLKAWIGVADAEYESGRLPQRPVPEGLPWLDGAQAEAIVAARQAYVHGYSRLIERGKSLIEAFFGEFTVACVALCRVTIEPGAALVVQGSLPAVLIIGELRLNGPGSLRLLTETRMCVDRLVRNDTERQGR